MGAHNYCTKLVTRWAKSRKTEFFIKSNKKWLDARDISFPVSNKTLHPEFVPETKNLGPSIKPFKQCNDKTKRRRIQKLLQTNESDEITFAAAVTLRASGKRDAATIVQELASSSPQRATNIKKMRANDNISRMFSKEEALAIYVDCKLTKNSYNLLRTSANNVGHNLYPSYYALQQTKSECCPPENYIVTTEISSEIELQAILDLTAQRLSIVQDVVLQRLIAAGVSELTLVSK